MAYTDMTSRKRIALIVHDNCKPGLVDWARYNRDTLARHELFGTGTL
jgi:methylglyoxal synthase